MSLGLRGKLAEQNSKRHAVLSLWFQTLPWGFCIGFPWSRIPRQTLTQVGRGNNLPTYFKGSMWLKCVRLSVKVSGAQMSLQFTQESQTFFYFFYFFYFLFFESGFLCGFGACPGTSSCRPGWPRTHKDPPASASRVLGLKACATTARPSPKLIITPPPQLLHADSHHADVIA